MPGDEVFETYDRGRTWGERTVRPPGAVAWAAAGCRPDCAGTSSGRVEGQR